MYHVWDWLTLHTPFPIVWNMRWCSSNTHALANKPYFPQLWLEKKKKHIESIFFPTVLRNAKSLLTLLHQGNSLLPSNFCAACQHCVIDLWLCSKNLWISYNNVCFKLDCASYVFFFSRISIKGHMLHSIWAVLLGGLIICFNLIDRVWRFF